MTIGSSTVACAQCGALNGADFGSCIRCNSKLDRTLPADRATRRVPAPRKRVAARGPGVEPLLGRFPAEMLPAMWILVALTALVFLAQVGPALQRDGSLSSLMDGGEPIDLFINGALPIGRISAAVPADLWLREPWRLLTACFVHFGIVHIAMNMLVLVSFAKAIEPVLGSVRFIIAYVFTGVMGFATNVGWYLFTRHAIFTAGASGAVFGMMGVGLGFMIRQRNPQWKAYLVRVVISSLLMAFAMGTMTPINNAAHIGGLVAGTAIGWAFGEGAPKPSTPWQRVLASLCVLAILASLLAVRFSPVLTGLSG